MVRPGAGDVWAAALLVLLSGLVWATSEAFPSIEGGHPGPALFPRAAAVVLALCALAMLRPLRSTDQRDHQPLCRRALVRVAAAAGIVVLFPLMPPIAGIGGAALGWDCFWASA